MAFKMKFSGFGAGTGSKKTKTISDIDRDASSEVAMDSAMGKKMQAPLKAVNMTKEEMEKFTADLRADAAQKETDKGSFGDAFNAARSAGKKEFTYKGKKYHTRTKEEEAKSSDDDSTKSSSNNNKSMERKLKSAEIARPDYQKRRQERRINRRRKKSGRSDIYDIRTDKKEARMKYGRDSEEFKKYKQELKDAKRSARQERRDNS
jgi:hypothetical protein